MTILFTKGLSVAGRRALKTALAGLLPRARFSPAPGGLKLSGPDPRRLADAAPAIENLPGVAAVKLGMAEACPLACSRRAPSRRPMDFSRGPVFIAGPCAVEDEASYLASAAALKAAGAHALRAAIFKPRSSPYAFQGIGWAGLRIISKAKKLTGLPLVTEATDTRQVERLAAVCDVLQIGARNMRNYELLKEIALSGRAALLKRAAGSSLRDWLLSAEYLLAGGCRSVLLCERGDLPLHDGGLDLELMTEARRISGIPVLADPSHPAHDRAGALRLAAKALRAGADGLLVEASADPLSARVDGRHTIDIEAFRGLTGK